ncbi:MAG: GDSL-type esterase/lipase family protein [Planctomycetaceae bacterium]|jgi:beta-glucosidase|nr:GDSL-type esterase/lipase family protein [Planctomycetaceae bacterium]
MKTNNYSTKLIGNVTLLTFVSLLFAFVILTLTSTEVLAQSRAVEPAARGDNWWGSRFVANIIQMERGNVDLLMIGDSITHGWDNAGKKTWEKYYAKRNPINLGFSGDQTQHVLWRLDHMPLGKIKPKAAVIMIGTNNIGSNSSTPKETADGIKLIVGKLEKQYPDIKIIVLHVFPRDEKPDGRLRKRVDEINSFLPELFKSDKNVKLLDINKAFLDENNILPKSIMPDSLHPNESGYKSWAEAVEPALVEIFGK